MNGTFEPLLGTTVACRAATGSAIPVLSMSQQTHLDPSAASEGSDEARHGAALRLVRLRLAREYWHRQGGLLLSSALVGILAGLIGLTKWPIDGLFTLGLVVGIDLLLHGAWWIMLGLSLKQQANEP